MLAYFTDPKEQAERGSQLKSIRWPYLTSRKQIRGVMAEAVTLFFLPNIDREGSSGLSCRIGYSLPDAV